MIKISICMISWNRAEIMKKALNHNLKMIKDRDKYNLEFLFADQGSTDNSVEVLKSYSPHYLRLNSKNEGVAQTFNQLMIRATGDYVCLWGNDILMDEDWLGEKLRYAKHIGDVCGLIGIKCTAALPPMSNQFGVNAHFIDEKIDKVFGNWLIPRHVLDCIGYFDENYIGYGLEDSDYNNRVTRTGFVSFYIPNKISRHLCDDVGKKNKYRRDKDNFLKHNIDYHNKKWWQKPIDINLVEKGIPFKNAI